MTHRSHQRGDRRGFSLVEVSVATTLLVLLASLLSSAWNLMGKPMVQTISTCRLAQEADMALTYLASDLGGCPPEASAGTKLAGQFVGWLAPSAQEFMLCFDSIDAPDGLPEWSAPDQVIQYQIVGGALMRYNALTGDECTVAQDLQSIHVQIVSDTLELTLTFVHRNVTQTYTLIASKP